MLDIGWTELLVVGVVALIVIGPKDLPGALRTFGKYVGRMRSMVRQFQDGINDIAHQEELREMQRSLNEATSGNPVKQYLEMDVDHDEEVKKAVAEEHAKAAETVETKAEATPVTDDHEVKVLESAPSEPSAAPAEPSPAEPSSSADTAQSAEPAKTAGPSAS